MAYEIISQNNNTTTLSDGTNTITVPGYVNLATGTTYTISEVNNSTATLEGSDGSVLRDIPCVAVLYGGGGGSDPHNLGYYADLTALQTAHPTGADGDFAILGSTDTVWVWDSGTSAWKDTDTKGQVTSVNTKTGVVVLSAEDVGATPQYSTMPTASADNLGAVIQYVGQDSGFYITGYFYVCVENTATTPHSYLWARKEVQPAGSTYAAYRPGWVTNSTTKAFCDSVAADSSAVKGQGYLGEVTCSDLPASMVNAEVIVEIMDGTTALNKVIVLTVTSGNTAPYRWQYTYWNNGSNVSGWKTWITNTSEYADGICIGDTATNRAGSVVIGYGANDGAGSANGIAIGTQAQVHGAGGIQIGTGTNNEAHTVCVGLKDSGNVQQNYKLLGQDGLIPKERLANAATSPSTMPTLAVADWSSNTQTVNVTGVTATNTVFVSPAPASAADFAAAGIVCTAQGSGTLTFTCDTVPSNAITVNVVIFG